MPGGVGLGVVERNKKKKRWGLPKPLRRRGCAWRDGVGDSGLVLNSTTELVVSHVWKGLFLRDEQLKVRKLPFYRVAERNKAKGKSGLPKPLRRRGCAWRDKVGNDDLLLKCL